MLLLYIVVYFRQKMLFFVAFCYFDIYNKKKECFIYGKEDVKYSNN